jgi:nucleotide-binding universal stress UspA family protein
MARDRNGSRLCRLNSALDHDVLVAKQGSISATTTATGVAVTQPAAFNRIAVSVGSAWELPVVERAARLLARRRRSQVLVIHVAINPLAADIFPESTVRRDIESPAEAQVLVEDAVRGLRRAGVVASAMVANEPTVSTADQIIRASAIFHADLLVICSRGLTDFRGLIQGSVSHQLLSRATCPILCLPSGLLRFDLRRIVVAWDGSPAALAALTVARRISLVHGASLTAVHVERDGAEPERSRLPDRVSLARIDERPGGVADTLNEAAHARAADLVVMGSHGRGDLAAMVLGSVTHRLLSISERPILVVRESGR